MVFGSRAVSLTHFSQATIDGDLALRTISADDRSGTALYDAVTLAASDLRKQPLPARVLILLTDGRDSGSFARLSDAVHEARAAGIIVYAIAIGSTEPQALETLARATGGRVYQSASPATLSSIYSHVRTELARTWRLSYTTSPSGTATNVTQLIPLLDRVPPVKGAAGRARRRPRLRPRRYRRLVRERGITPVIARRKAEHGSGLGTVRWVVERTFAWLHHFKRLLVRYDRRHEIHEAFLAIGCCLICYRRLQNSF